MLYSKNGSIPKPETDGTGGWIEVPDAPEAPEGKEVVWWYPPGWVVRDPMPAARDGYKWSWSQSSEQWVEYALPEVPAVEVQAVASGDTQALASEDISELSSGDIASLTTDQISALG
jgi:hypothetical protein